jgi:hypothetical protein
MMHAEKEKNEKKDYKSPTHHTILPIVPPLLLHSRKNHATCKHTDFLSLPPLFVLPVSLPPSPQFPLVLLSFPI